MKERILQKWKRHGYFMQDNTVAHNYAINVLNKIFEKGLVSHKLWFAASPDLNPCSFYLWGN
jgi:hypothetical protein